MKKLCAIILATIMLVSVFAFTAAAKTETKTVDVTWNLGYVGSSTNSSYAGKVNPGGSSYSYSDVIDMGPAGSTITFTDTVPGFASASAYVISVWKKDGDNYVIDPDGAHVAGSGGSGSVTYRFVTTEDNQAIRVTYRSEQTTTNTPTFEDVFIDGVKVTTNWSLGYVGSPSHPTVANRNKIVVGGSYSYSDIIVVPKAGSVVTLTDNDGKYASSAAAVFSTWTKDGDDWVIVPEKSVDGAQAFDTATGTGDAKYTYTSTKDNELVRLSYRSEQTASYTPAASARPVVTLTYNVPDPEFNPGTGDSTSLIILASLLALTAFAGAARFGKKR